MSDQNANAMLRVVRWHHVRQLAEVIEEPWRVDPGLTWAQAFDAADPATAEEMIQDWLIRQAMAAGPFITAHGARQLLSVDARLRALAGGRVALLHSEIGYYSGQVSPDHREVRWDYEQFAQKWSGRLWTPGVALYFTGERGAGKTTLGVRFAEERLAEGWHVISNMGHVRIRSEARHAYEAGWHHRIHEGRRLSDILKAWASTPPDTRFLVLVDEPRASLRAGRNASTDNWAVFQDLIRKLDMVVAEIWHNLAEIYKEGREGIEGDGAKFVHIHKKNHHELSVACAEHTANVTGVPEPEILSFETKGTGTMIVDVDMERFTDFLAGYEHEAARKEAALRALGDGRFYLEKWVEGEGRLSAAEVAAHVQADPGPFLNQRASFDSDMIRHVHGHLSVRDAQAVAKILNRRVPLEDRQAAREAASETD